MAIDNLPEEWRPVEGWPYEVSNLGRVRRVLVRPLNDHERRPLKRIQTSRDQRQHVHLWDGPRRKMFRIHRMVAAAFLGPQPSPTHEIAHWDGDATNNRTENLRWATKRENRDDMLRHGRLPRGSKNGRHKLTESDVVKILHLYDTDLLSQSEIGRRFSVCQSTVSLIVNRKKWRHVYAGE